MNLYYLTLTTDIFFFINGLRFGRNRHKVWLDNFNGRKRNTHSIKMHPVESMLVGVGERTTIFSNLLVLGFQTRRDRVQNKKKV